MEWIKITKETKLPENCELLLSYDWAGSWYFETGDMVLGNFEASTPGKQLSQFTHYIILTPPKD